jgi:hypothetical protein
MKSQPSAVVFTLSISVVVVQPSAGLWKNLNPRHAILKPLREQIARTFKER